MTPNYGYRGGVAVDLDALEAKAEAATKGPWKATRKARNPEGKPDEVWTADESLFVAECMNVRMVEDAAFIAATNPDTVLELIRRIRGLEDGILEDYERWNFNTLFTVAQALLRNYPENSIVCNESGDPGARFAFHLRKALDSLAASPSPVEGPTE